MTQQIRFASFWVLAVAPAAIAGEPIVVGGDIDSVTVYRGQALVTRVVDVSRPPGLQEVILTDLPEHIVPASLYAESEDEVEVRSVRYRESPVKEDLRDAVQEIDNQLQVLGDKIHGIQRRYALLAEKRAYLERLEQFTAPTANVELSKGVLNAETLKSLTSFVFDQREAIAEEDLSLKREERDLKDEQELLRRKRDMLAGSSARTVREAVIFVNVVAPDGGRLRVRYLVDRANWSPFYNLRAAGDSDEVILEYYASVQQMSAEDWNDVTMTLSTATPNLVARSPDLESLSIALSASGAAQGATAQRAMPAGEYERAKQALIETKKSVGERRARQQQLDVEQVVRFVEQRPGGAGPFDYDEVLNRVAADMQVLDLLYYGRIGGARTGGSSHQYEGISVTYQIASRTTLPSRSDRQLIQIASLPLPATFYKVATPVLTDYVYNEADVTNSSQMALLSGTVSSYLDGEFVGNGQLPTVSVGERFTTGLGIDPSLRAGRELLKKSETIQGGNRIADFTYRLTLENFSQDTVGVRLLDRLPRAKGPEIDVTLTSEGCDLSTEPGYLQTDRKRGILRWDVQIPPDSDGPDAFVLDYGFRLEYDKQMAITTRHEPSSREPSSMVP